jgi:hypothetical protein
MRSCHCTSPNGLTNLSQASRDRLLESADGVDDGADDGGIALLNLDGSRGRKGQRGKGEEVGEPHFVGFGNERESGGCTGA